MTPGPWKVISGNKEFIYVCAADGSTLPALIPRWEDSLTESRKNAHLVAAAPELLETLRVVWHNGKNAPNDELLLRIERAINAALNGEVK